MAQQAADLDVDVRAIRKKTRLTQAAFAAKYHFSIRDIQNWEQDICEPHTMERIYLKLIEQNPELVNKVLNDLRATKID